MTIQNGHAGLPDFRIVGVHRSGTNYVRYLVESSTDLTCGFNVGWWKHGIVSTRMHRLENVPEIVPTLFVFRQPIDQMVSFYKFALLRKAMKSDHLGSISDFIRHSMTIGHPNAADYWYPNPVCAWHQYYFAALSWQGLKAFVYLDDIRENPPRIQQVLQTLLKREVQVDEISPDLNFYMRRNLDRPLISDGTGVEPIPLEQEKKKNDEIAAHMTQEDRAFILSSGVQELFNRLMGVARL